MTGDFFAPADILLPDAALCDLWSVIACDQFSSDRDYWERVLGRVEGKPSTLHMIIPEAYLGERDAADYASDIADAMDSYQRSGILRQLPDSLIYLERTLENGNVRRGLVGAIDLERYEYTPGARADILASEGTILDRLPPRVAVRKKAPLELPHVMAFLDDEERTVIEPITAMTGSLEKLYDFELMEGGGYIRGWRVCGDSAERVMSAFRALKSDGATIIIGDGNHSLAAAKTYWDAIKESLSDAERETHPARYALLELNNVYDPAISFEAIHRVVFTPEPDALIDRLGCLSGGGNGYSVRWAAGGGGGEIAVSAGSVGELIERLQAVLDEYIMETGCKIDYIHGDEEVRGLAAVDGAVAFLLPVLEKSDFFATVRRGGVFPRKSFSVGHARDKRYYLECRRIRP